MGYFGNQARAAMLSGLGVVVLALPGAAQEKAGTSYTVNRMNPANPVELNVAEAMTLDFADPFSELSIAQPATADISSLSDRTVYLVGKAVGDTTLTVVRPDGAVDHLPIRIIRDTAALERFLAQAVPGVSLVRDGTLISLTGCFAAGEAPALTAVVRTLAGWGYVPLSDTGAC